MKNLGGGGGTSFQRFFSPLVHPDLRGATRHSSLPQSHAPRGASILYHLSRLRTLLVATGAAPLFRASNPHWPRYNPSLHAISEYPERHRSLGTRAASPSATRPAPTRPAARHSRTEDRNCLGQLPSGILEQRRRSLRSIGRQELGQRLSRQLGRGPSSQASRNSRGVMACRLPGAAVFVPHRHAAQKSFASKRGAHMVRPDRRPSAPRDRPRKAQSRPETQTGTLAATRSRRVSPAPAYLHRSRAPHASPANANQSQSALRAAQAASELAQYRAIRASSGTGQAAPANQRRNAQEAAPERKAPGNHYRSSARRHPQHGAARCGHESSRRAERTRAPQT